MSLQRTRSLSRLACVFLLVACASADIPAPARPKPSGPNVLFVIYDDMNLAVGTYGDPQAITPNLDRLARGGMRFDNAHANAPTCAPSRSSFLTGLYPSTTGLYRTQRYYKKARLRRNLRSIFEHAGAAGYRVYGAGKIFHSNWGERRIARQFDDYQDIWSMDAAMATYKGKHRRHPANPATRGDDPVFASWGPLSDVPTAEKYGPGWQGWGDFRYVSETDRDPMRDERSTQWAVERIRDAGDEPFFLTVGYRRPHIPLHAPKQFFDLYDPATLVLPPVRPDDLDDVVPTMRMPSLGSRIWERIQAMPDAEAVWRDYYRAYLACVSFADSQLGRLLAALDEAGHAQDTIVVVTSDQGYHWGDKLRIGKATPWNGTTRIPLIVRAPGLTTAGSTTNHPVSLVDLYPTLIELMHLPPSPHGPAFPLDGRSLVPLLRAPADAPGPFPPALLQRNEDVWTVADERYRYVVDATGAEELYDHRRDPEEWSNVAADADLGAVKSRLRSELLQLTGGKLPRKRTRRPE